MRKSTLRLSNKLSQVEIQEHLISIHKLEDCIKSQMGVAGTSTSLLELMYGQLICSYQKLTKVLLSGTSIEGWYKSYARKGTKSQRKISSLRTMLGILGSGKDSRKKRRSTLKSITR